MLVLDGRKIEEKAAAAFQRMPRSMRRKPREQKNFYWSLLAGQENKRSQRMIFHNTKRRTRKSDFFVIYRFDSRQTNRKVFSAHLWWIDWIRSDS